MGLCGEAKSGLAREPCERLLLNDRVIPKAGEPVDTGFTFEPGELALGIAARRLLNSHASSVKRHLSAKHCAEFAVADEIERLGVFRQAGTEQRANFVKPAVGEHRIGASVNALVQSFAF